MPIFVNEPLYMKDVESQIKEAWSMSDDEKVECLISLDSEGWQYLVLQSLSALHAENNKGSISIEPVVGGGHPIEYEQLEWDISFFDESECEGLTDHVIKIGDIWWHVKRQLDKLGVAYLNQDPDLTQIPKIGLQECINVYMAYLCEKGYVVDLNTRMGHTDELSYRLKDAFFDAMVTK